MPIFGTVAAIKELRTAASVHGYGVAFSEVQGQLNVQVFMNHQWCAYVSVPIANGSVDLCALGDAINAYLHLSCGCPPCAHPWSTDGSNLQRSASRRRVIFRSAISCLRFVPKGEDCACLFPGRLFSAIHFNTDEGLETVS